MGTSDVWSFWASFEAAERFFSGAVPTDSRVEVEQIDLTDPPTEQSQK